MTIRLAGDGPVFRKEPGPRAQVNDILLLAMAGISGIVFSLGLVGLFDPQTVLDWAKVAAFTIGSALVAYGVNRLAIKSAANLAVKGLHATGVAAVGIMLFVGTALATATYAGLTLDPTEALRLEQHGTALSQRAGDNARTASPSVQASQVMRGIASDLAIKSECEPLDSCVSRRPKGGRGPMTRLLILHKQRAEAVAAQVDATIGTGQERTNLAGPLLARYSAVLAEPGPARTKRGDLQRIDGQVREALAGRIAGDPAGILAAYAAELESPVSIAAQPEAARILTAILQTHSNNLKRALAAPAAKEAGLPAFPGRTGVGDTLGYIGHFWPVAAIAVVLDCLFPLLFWICVYSTKWWQGYIIDPARKPRPPREDDLDLNVRPPQPHPPIRPVFDPEAMFPTLTPSRSRLEHDNMRGGDAR